MEVEGAAPAKIYYDKYGVTFHRLVDPNYATGFGYVPWTFFIDEHGIVQDKRGWEDRLVPESQLRPVTDAIRKQWSPVGARLAPEAIAALVKKLEANPKDLEVTVELASRYLALGLYERARLVLDAALEHHDDRDVARSGDRARSLLLSQARLQLARSHQGDREAQVKHATLSFYLNPSIGLGKQIARIIAPEKFDHRPDGRFDVQFREGTLRRLRAERAKWLAEDDSGE